MVYVYLLECGDGTLYTGITPDLVKRLHLHRTGKGAKYTRGRGPLRVCYVETHPNRSSALKRERAIKKLTRTQKRNMIQNICLLPGAGEPPLTR